jgi:Peptidase M15
MPVPRRPLKTHALIPLALAPLTAVLAAPRALAFDAGLARFSIRVKGIVNPYQTMSVTVMPRESFAVEVLPVSSSPAVSAEADCGQLKDAGRGRWTFHAPALSGRCRLKLKQRELDESMELNVFVLLPANRIKGERLNGYRIGHYPARSSGRNSVYEPPRGFIEVLKGDTDIHLSPHFEMGTFVSKQGDPFPKYLFLDERLLLKLEAILAELRVAGVPADTLHVMSGYRTPFYNQAIENVPYSMHVFGGAADIFVDKDGNDMMDDLTGDKVVDIDDARFLYDFIDRLERTHGRMPWIGGLGLYPATSAHGPFVHVDVRGRSARWGDVVARDRPKAVPAPSSPSK